MRIICSLYFIFQLLQKKTRHYLVSVNYRSSQEGTILLQYIKEILNPLTTYFNFVNKVISERQVLMGKSPGYLLHSIIDALVDNLLHILKKIIGDLDNLEESVFNDRKSDVKALSLLRREITSLRRIVVRLRRTMSDVTKDIQKFAEEDLMPYFADVEDRIEKIFEELEESKETVEIYKDTDFMLSTEKSNKILAILTIIFTLSIPTSRLLLSMKIKKYSARQYCPSMDISRRIYDYGIDIVRVHNVWFVHVLVFQSPWVD